MAIILFLQLVFLELLNAANIIQRDEENIITYVCFIDKAITLTHVVDDDGGNDTCHVHKQQPGRDVYKEGILSHWHTQHFHA